jgi:hypothetical protein
VLPNRTVKLSVSREGQELYSYFDLTNADGLVTLKLPTGQSVPSGVLTVTADVYGASGQVVDTDTLVLDTAKLTLTDGDPAAGNPLGFSVRATDLSATAVAGRTVRFTVTRNGTELYSRDVTTDEDGVAVAPLKSGVTTAPAGEIRIVARLLDVSGENVQDTVSATKTIADAPVTLSAVTPAYAVTRAGRTYTLGTPLSVKVSDPYGDVPFYTVMFGFPTGPGVATATFKTSPTASPAASVNATTTASGVATVPATTIVTAGTLVGSFNLTITATGDSRTIPFAAQYLLSPYGAPVDGATVDTSTGATVPLKTTAVLADDTQLSDALSAQLVPTRVQLRYREQGTSLWKLSTIPIVYDSKKHFFQVDLKPSSLSMSKGKKYDVEFRVRALAPKPSGDELQLNFDLGRRRVVINVTK